MMGPEWIWVVVVVVVLAAVVVAAFTGGPPALRSWSSTPDNSTGQA